MSDADQTYNLNDNSRKKPIVKPGTEHFKYKRPEGQGIDNLCPTTFEKVIRKEGWDSGRSVARASDGGFVLLGATGSTGSGGTDMYLVKVDNTGKELWAKTIGGTGNEYGYSIDNTLDGGFILLGSTNSHADDLKGGYDMYLVKVTPSDNPDKEPDIAWEMRIGGAGDDEGFSVQETLDGGFILLGSSNSHTDASKGGYDMYLVKIKPEGDDNAAPGIEWQKRYGGVRDDYGFSVAKTQDGGFALVGSTRSFSKGVVSENDIHHMPDIYLIKTDSSGGVQWTRIFGGTGNETGYSVKETDDGGLILLGMTDSFTPDFIHDDVSYHFNNMYLIKTDNLGNPVWNPAGSRGKVFGDVLYGNYVGYTVIETKDGGYMLSGSADLGDGEKRVHIVKIYPDGEVEWKKTSYDGANCFSMLEDPDCGYILFGDILESGIGNTGRDAFLVKIDDSGNVDYYKDNDGDGYGRDDYSVRALSPPIGYVRDKGDCNDNDPAIHPDAVDLPYDGIDTNCDGVNENLCSIKVPEDYATIQEAIDEAEKGYTICVNDGTYKENINFKGRKITLKSVNGPAKTIIDGNNADSVVIFNHSEEPSTVIDGFTITNGGNSSGGGGIKCMHSSPTIKNCKIFNNTAWSGGGIYLTFSSPTIENCNIVKNTAESGNGGGIYCNDSSLPNIVNCTIEKNESSFSGGGIYSGYSSPIMITGSYILDNKSKDSGGGLHCNYFSPPTIDRTVISGNYGSGGGGLFCIKSQPTITNCTITDNSSKDAGGGILCMQDSPPVITNCTIANNIAINTSGGGMFCYDAPPTVTNSIFWNNKAGTKGSEVHLLGEESTMEVTSSDINTEEIFGPWTGMNNLNEDPKFVDDTNVNPLLRDYHITSDSPCIDKGSGYEAPEKDIDGDPRPSGKGVDIGSDEYMEISE